MRLPSIIVLLALASGASAADIQGQAEVVDGDTVRMSGQRIRLWGIDAPEMATPAGPPAKAQLERIVGRHVLRCAPNGHDRNRRPVAICYLPDGSDIARLMVRSGHAADWPRYSGGYYAR